VSFLQKSLAAWPRVLTATRPSTLAQITSLSLVLLLSMGTSMI
jgi:hypothetical protein